MFSWNFFSYSLFLYIIIHPNYWGILGGVIVLLKFIWDTLMFILLFLKEGTRWCENNGFGYLHYLSITMMLSKLLFELSSKVTIHFIYWGWAILRIMSKWNIWYIKLFLCQKISQSTDITRSILKLFIIF